MINENTLISLFPQPHTFKKANNKLIINTLNALEKGQQFVIEYYKIPNKETEDKQLKKALRDINNLSPFSCKEEYKKILKRLLKEHRGEKNTSLYEKTNEFKNESGYLLFQDSYKEWKSVDVRNIISIITEDGVKLIR